MKKSKKSPMIIELFTDGSSSTVKKKYSGSSAFHVYMKDRLITTGGKFLKGGTSNLGEIHSVLIGLNQIERLVEKVDDKFKKDKVIIMVYMDSLISCEGLRSWIYKWIKNSKNGVLRNYTGKAVANQDVYIDIFNKHITPAKMDIRFMHLNSHTIDVNLYKNNIIMIKDYFKNRHSIANIDPLPTKFFEREKFKKHKDSFIRTNKRSITDIEFLRLLVYNREVDILADQILKEGLGEGDKTVKVQKERKTRKTVKRKESKKINQEVK